MKKILCCQIILLISLWSFGQVIPDERRVDWENGIKEININYPGDVFNVKDYGAVGNGIHDDGEAIVSTINALNGEAGTIFFPKGSYLITQTLSITNNVFFRGQSSDSTTLLFTLGNDGGHCIQIAGSPASDFIQLDSGYEKESDWMTTDSSFLFEAGDYVELLQNNGDWDIAPIGWADNSVGQIMQLDLINGDTLFFMQPLRYTYSSGLNPRLRRIQAVENTGISCLKIKRLDQVNNQAGSNIFYNYAINSMVKGVESDSSVGSHISINASSNIQIQGCYIHHGFTYDGTGTRGYGVTLSRHSGQCLIANNIFKHLRHAMMVKTGSNGNVFSYNYSRDPIRTEPIPDASGDISLHGHFAFANLFEHNIIQNIIIDHYWGPSGPENTFFRNRAELYGIIMTTNEIYETGFQNFVGNETTDGSLFHGQYFLTGTDHFEFGNNILGVTIPDFTSNLSDSSYYLNEPPDFWDVQEDWPSIGYPNELNMGKIPAKERYLNGGQMTVCPDSVPTWLIDNQIQSDWVKYWPNPAHSHLNLELTTGTSSPVSLQIFNGNAQLIQEHMLATNAKLSKHHISLGSSLPPGMYFLTFTTANEVVRKKLIIGVK